MLICEHEQIRGRLRSRVRRRRLELRCFAETALRAERAVYLVRAHLDEPPHTGPERGVEQHLRSRNVGLDEDRRTQDAAVDVTLRREVENRLDPVALKEVVEELCVGDVALDEDVLPIVPQ